MDISRFLDKRVGPFEVKGKTVQYQEKFLLQLMHPCKIWNVRGNTTTQKYLGVVSVSGSHWHWTNEVHVHVLGE